MTTKKRIHRTPEQKIADLQAEIERIKVRAAQAKVKKDPALKHISGAVRAIDKAAALTKDATTRSALAEARGTLASCLALNGVLPGGAGARVSPRSSTEAPDAKRVLAYIRNHPGSGSSEICSELGTDSTSLRTVLHRLRDEGQIKVAGKARATRYTAKK